MAPEGKGLCNKESDTVLILGQLTVSWERQCCKYWDSVPYCAYERGAWSRIGGRMASQASGRMWYLIWAWRVRIYHRGWQKREWAFQAVGILVPKAKRSQKKKKSYSWNMGCKRETERDKRWGHRAQREPCHGKLSTPQIELTCSLWVTESLMKQESNCCGLNCVPSKRCIGALTPKSPYLKRRSLQRSST